MNFKEKLEMTKYMYLDMKLVVDTCIKAEKNGSNMWNIFWDSFWESSNSIPFKIDWLDYDTSYKEDMLMRFNAVENFARDLELLGE